MEAFVEKHPTNVEALEQLGKYYQYAQRPHAYIANLEVIAQLRPTEPQLRELSQSLNFIGEYGKQIEVLKSLTRLYRGTPRDFMGLTYLQASQALFEDALVTIRTLERRFPKEADEGIVELKLSLALDVNQIELAYRDAVSWLANNPASALKLIILFRFKNHPSSAYRLVRLFQERVDDEPDLLEQLVELQIEHQASAEALPA